MAKPTEPKLESTALEASPATPDPIHLTSLDFVYKDVKNSIYVMVLSFPHVN